MFAALPRFAYLVLLALAIHAQSAFADEAPAEPAPIPVTPQVRADCEAVVHGNTRFALDLYARLRSKPGNLIYSPYSISTALAMTYAGADGSTADQMARVLRFPRYQLRLHRAFAALRRGMIADGKKGEIQLHVANALWGQKGYEFLDEFQSTARDYYGAPIREVDFKGNPGAVRRTINAWVARQTRDRIQDIVPANALNPDTRLVLANAVYFKADWARQFAKRNTSDEPFHLSPKKSVKVPLMVDRAHFHYLNGGTFQVLELPYADGDRPPPKKKSRSGAEGTSVRSEQQPRDMSMVFLLPKQVDGLPELEKDLTADRLSGWLAKMKSTDVVYYIPRFEVKQELNLSKELSDMGMADAFSPVDCNFSRMSPEKDLFISAVLHQAFAKVAEGGTEAAAATVVVMEKKEEAKEKPKPKVPEVFRADHPFLFLIRDRRSGSILFLGRLVNPRS